MRQSPHSDNGAMRTSHAELSCIAGATVRDHTIKVSMWASGDSSRDTLKIASTTRNPEHTKKTIETRFGAVLVDVRVGEMFTLEQRRIAWDRTFIEGDSR